MHSSESHLAKWLIWVALIGEEGLALSASECADLWQMAHSREGPGDIQLAPTLGAVWRFLLIVAVIRHCAEDCQRI
jgi:hypothetical protein